MNSYDTQVCGILTIVVSWMCGERIVKSEIYCGEISRSISTSGEKPTPPFDGLIEQVCNAAIKTKESADRAEAAEDLAAETASAAREAAVDARASKQACEEILESVQSTVAEAGAVQVQAVKDKGAEAMDSVAAVGAEQVSAVQAASDNSKTAIERKTDEQLARIPEVTELAEDVSSLKGDLVQLVTKNEIEPINLWNYETTTVGQLDHNYPNDVNTNSVDYVNTDFIPFKTGESFYVCYLRTDYNTINQVTPQVSNGSRMLMYDSNKNYLYTKTGTFPAPYVIDIGNVAYVRFGFAKLHFTNAARKYCISKTEITDVDNFPLYFEPYATAEINKNVLPIDLKNVVGNNNIVNCWGDSLTDGAGSTSAGGGAYPSRLQNLLGESYTVNNYGIGGEGAELVSMRQGSTPLYIKPCTIPSDGNEVNCNLYNWRGDVVPAGAKMRDTPHIAI